MREIDEDPAAEDIERFGAETIVCPHCGAEMWDEAPACPSCGAWVGEDRSADPVRARRRRVWITVVAIIVIVAFLVAVLA